MTEIRLALIVDIVGSRALDDRDAAQRAITGSFATATEGHPPVRPLWATFADEFQALFATVSDALRATTLVRLTLPDGVDCRFGLGLGEVREVESPVDAVRTAPIQDGSGWWRARAAIEEAHRREDRTNPYLRGWFVSDDDEAALERAAIVNSFLLLRDQSIGAMRPRERRLTAGAMLGRPQADLAALEGISQSAVSQSLQRSGGAALVASHQLVESLSGSHGSGSNG